MKSTKSLWRVFLLACCLLIIFAGVFTATAAKDEDKPVVADCVQLYSKEAYEGEKQEFTVGEYPDVTFKSKSIQIPAEFEVRAYTEKNFKGREYILQYGREKFFSAHMGHGDFNFIIGWDYIPRIKSLKVRLIESEAVDITNLDDTALNDLLIKFAPRIYMAKGDEYGAISIDDAFENMERYKSSSGYYSLRLKDGITKNNPFEIKQFFYGDNETATAYGFKVDKDGGYMDFSYFQLCSFDSGKYIKILRRNIGSHVCDWEHVTLRFKVFEADGKRYIRPIKAAFNVHSGLVSYENWENLEKINGTHIQVYCAAGSHGIYASEGEHHYVNFGAIQKLTDSCSKGTPIDLWQDGRLETFDYTPAKDKETLPVCRALNGSKWAGCFVNIKDDDDGTSVRKWGESPVVSGIHGNSPSGPQGKNEINSTETFS